MAKPKMDYKIEVPLYLDGYINVYILNAAQVIEKIVEIEGVSKTTVMNEAWIIVYTSPLYDTQEVAQEIERVISIPGVFLGDGESEGNDE